MKLRYIITSILTTLILAVGCNQEQTFDLPGIKVSKSYVTIPLAGGSDKVTLNTTGDWKIVSLVEVTEKGKGTGEFEYGEIPEWIEISKTSGKATDEVITFAAEETLNDRSATLLIVSEDQEQYMLVKQVAGAPNTTPSTVEEIKAGVSGKVYIVEGTVKNISNTVYGNFYVEDETGELYVYGVLDANGQSANFLSLNIEEGDKVVLSGARSEYGGNPQLKEASLVKLTKSLIKVTPSVSEIEKEATTFEVKVIAKGDGFSIEFGEGSDWLSVRGQRVDNDTTFVTFAATANEATSPRDAKVAFASSKGGATSKVEMAVEQKGNMPPVSKIAAVIGQKGSTVTVAGRIVAACKTGYVIKDETACLFIYKGAHEARLGDNMTIVGVMGAYNYAAQIQAPSLEEKAGYGKVEHDAAHVFDAAGIEAFISDIKELPSDGKFGIEYVSMTGTMSASASSNYVNLIIEGTTVGQGSIYYPTDEHKAKCVELNGKTVTVKGYLVQVSSKKYMNIVMDTIEEN